MRRGFVSCYLIFFNQYSFSHSQRDLQARKALMSESKVFNSLSSTSPFIGPHSCSHFTFSPRIFSRPPLSRRVAEHLKQCFDWSRRKIQRVRGGRVLSSVRASI